MGTRVMNEFSESPSHHDHGKLSHLHQQIDDEMSDLPSLRRPDNPGQKHPDPQAREFY